MMNGGTRLPSMSVNPNSRASSPAWNALPDLRIKLPSHEPWSYGDGCDTMLTKLQGQAPKQAHDRVLGEIVEVPDVFVVVPRDSADDEAGRMRTLGLDHQGNRKIRCQEVSLQPALDHGVPKPKRRLQKYAGAASSRS